MSAQRRQELRDKISAHQNEVEKSERQSQAWKERANKLQTLKQQLKAELRKLEQEPVEPEKELIEIKAEDVGELKLS